jgi:hypothetical protein
MYGIINKSLEELVTANFGEEKWEAIKLRGGIDVDYFISNEIYDDDLTLTLAKSVAEEMGMTLSAVLVTFGEWWIINTTKERYGGLMEAGGNNLKEFLVNLPFFHNRVLLIYPKSSPPDFKVSDVTENSMNLHYASKREGFQDFVRGLIQGLGTVYNTPVTISLTQTGDECNSHDVFKVIW